MRRVAPVLVLAAILSGASPAAAQVGIRADAGWLSWSPDGGDGRVLARGNEMFPFPRAFVADLGSDARGRSVGTYVACSHTRTRAIRGCSIRERLLGTTHGRTLVRERDGFVVDSVAQHRGALAVAEDRGRSSRILLRRPGESRFRVLAHKRRAVRLDLESGLLSSREFGDRDYVRTIDLRGPRPRTRTFAADDTRDFDCKCEQKLVQIMDATLDGRYVYWLEATVRSTDGSSIGTGSHAALFSARFLRADALAARPAVEEYRILDEDPTGRGVPNSFAVERGRIYHDALSDLRRGVRPAWRRTGERLPIET